MKLLYAFWISLFFANAVFAQQTIDDGFAFQTESFKSYHIYVPSQYDEATPHSLMLAFHPFNTARWNGESWRDTLITFAETNNLILVSPDGGPDGKIDDPIDTAFTSVLIDSMSIWYNIDESERYIMGFSWGGRTTYSYGLNNYSKYKGFMPIGAATSIDMVDDIIGNSVEKTFYLVHGSQDAPSTRYTPFVDALNNNGACIESLLMNGVGHTIDFPNRNEILSTAFDYIKKECPFIINSVEENSGEENESEIQISPNPNDGSFRIETDIAIDPQQVEVYNINGSPLRFSIEGNTVQLIEKRSGTYILMYDEDGQKHTARFFVH